LVQSLDGGAHWSWICESAIQADGFQDPPLVIGGGGLILLGLNDGVHLGDNSACQWTRAQADFSGEEVIDMAGNSTHIFATSLAQLKGALEARVAVSTDGGQHFATLGSVLDDASPVTIEVAPSLSSRLYLGMLDGNLENGLIARSDDGGLNWVRSPAPSGPDSLFVSTDAGTTWSAAYTSVSELTGFALSPDGQRLAVGSADGVAILDAAASAGTPYEVIATYAAPVNCLTWHGTALYACSTDASGGFSIGVSADGRGDFSPLLRFADLEPITCPSNSALVQCASAPCVIGDLFDAGCVGPEPLMPRDAGSPARASAPVLHSAGESCTLGNATRNGGDGARALGLLLGALAFRRRRDRWPGTGHYGRRPYTRSAPENVAR
jgi:hypothetical protein